MEHQEGKRGESRDPTTGSGGIEYLFGLPFPMPQTMRNAPVVAVLPDAKLYVGDVEAGGSGSTVFVARTGRDGEVDTTFAQHGWVAEHLEIGLGVLVGLLPRDNGGVIAMVKYGSNAALEVALVCFRADGALDPDFGEGGKIVHRIPTPAAVEYEAAPVGDAYGVPQEGTTTQGLGTNIAAAKNGAFYCLIGVRGEGPFYALIRCLPDGRLDPGFNGTGVVTDGEWYFRAWSATDMVVGADGRVMLVGAYYNINNSPARRLAFWRFHPDGALDRSFGDQGFAFFDADSSGIDGRHLYQMELNHAAALPDGGVVACGSLVTRSEANVFQHFGLLARLDSSGKLPDTFNGGKFRLFGVMGNYQTSFTFGGLGVQGDGKIVAGGGVGNSPVTDRELLVARFLPTGAVDSMFGSGGTVRFSPNDSRVNYMSDLLIDSSGKILGAGGGGPNNNIGSMTQFVFQLSA